MNEHFSVGMGVGMFGVRFEGDFGGLEFLRFKSFSRVVSIDKVSEVSIQFDFMSIETDNRVFRSSSIMPVKFHISNSGFFLFEGNRGLSLSIRT